MLQPTKLGPGDQKREQHHLKRDIALGHLFFPEGDQISDMTTRVRPVDKPHEKPDECGWLWGRLVFLPLNQVLQPP